MRNDGRAVDQLRPIKITRGFTQTPAGSVLWEQGKTVLFCTASITKELPPWFKEDRAGGWLTAEYVMLPASTPQRKAWPKTGHTDSRGTEIQRLIGRAIRAVVDLSKIGPHTIALDCQVLQADGGTRTAAICGAYVALADAIAKLPKIMPGAQRPISNEGSAGVQPPMPARYDASHYDPSQALLDQLAAVSVGIVDGEARLDLDYFDDSPRRGRYERRLHPPRQIRGDPGLSREWGRIRSAQMNTMTDLAVRGCEQIMEIQRDALRRKNQ